MRPTTRILLGSLLVFSLAGCSSGGGQSSQVASLGGTGTATTGAQAQQQDTTEHDALVKFAQCMRQHGINMPDPQPGGAMQMPAGADSDPATKQKFETAQTACASDLPNGGKPTAGQLDRQLKFAQCMRQHGVNMPDPTGNGSSVSIDMSDPATKAALTACESAAAASTTTTAGATSGH